MKRLIQCIVMLLTAVSMQAARALSEPFTVQQPDGSWLTLTCYGDEHANWLTTDDGVLVVQTKGAYYVAAINDDGALTATALLAHQPQQRSMQEQQLCQQQQQRRRLFFEQANRTIQKVRRAQVTSADYLPHKGSPKCLVILVNFSDNKFASEDPKTQFDQYFNGEKQEDMGHNEQKNLVSVKEYYNQSSLGKFTPNFTIVGPYTLPQELDYYGKDQGSSKDVNFAQFCKDAIAAADADVNFKDYDNTGDNKVELVCIIYAGYGQSNNTKLHSTIWPKCGYRGIDTDDGVTVSYCNCSPELNRVSSGSDINGIGLFNHEFSHGMGLPDHYITSIDIDDDNVDSETAAKLDNQTPEFWDLMDYGEYADNGYAPVPYSVWEQSVMDWIEVEELTQSQTIFPLKPTVKGGKAYKFGNGNNPEEWMMIEAEERTDATNRKLGSYRGEGLLVWHIAYNKPIVSMGDFPNNTLGVPKVSIVPADGLVINGYRFVNRGGTPTEKRPWTVDEYIASLKGDPFPGTSNVTTLNAEQKLPNFIFYNGEATPKQTLTNITRTPDGLISFDFNDGVTPVVHVVESLKLNEEKLELEEEETFQMQANILPTDAEDQRIYWSVVDELVANIDANGLVTAVGEGTTLVIGRSIENPASWQSCEVTVTHKEPSGITNIKTNTTKEGSIFDLQGRRISGTPTQHGIYIIQGKKVVR